MSKGSGWWLQAMPVVNVDKDAINGVGVFLGCKAWSFWFRGLVFLGSIRGTQRLAFQPSPSGFPTKP
ncbi:hypothetical protein COP2_009560 [Malus domestica]